MAQDKPVCGAERIRGAAVRAKCGRQAQVDRPRADGYWGLHLALLHSVQLGFFTERFVVAYVRQ